MKDDLTFTDYYNRAKTHSNQGQYAYAILDYTEGLRIDPTNDSGAYNNRGIAYQNLGKLAEAIADYTEALREDPNYVEAYNNRGVAYQKQGKFPEAIVDYDKALQIEPKNAQVHENRGVAYQKQGQPVEALLDYIQALRLDPNNKVFRRYLKIFLSETKNALLNAIKNLPEEKQTSLVKYLDSSPVLGSSFWKPKYFTTYGIEEKMLKELSNYIKILKENNKAASSLTESIINNCFFSKTDSKEYLKKENITFNDKTFDSVL